jgi:hypothetical protein
MREEGSGGKNEGVVQAGGHAKSVRCVGEEIDGMENGSGCMMNGVTKVGGGCLGNGERPGSRSW